MLSYAASTLWINSGGSGGNGPYSPPPTAAVGMPVLSNIPYTSVSPLEGNMTFSVPRIYTTPRKRVELQPTYGVYLRWLTTLKISASDWTNAAPAGVYPKLRDKIVVNGVSWTVHRDVDSPTPLMGMWRLMCTYLEIKAQLQDTIDILLPTDSTDASGSPLTTSTATSNLAGMACRIQFLREEAEDYQGVQYVRPWYRIFVQALDDNLPIGTLIKATIGEYSGTTFRFVSNDNIEQIDELEMLTVTVDP